MNTLLDLVNMYRLRKNLGGTAFKIYNRILPIIPWLMQGDFEAIAQVINSSSDAQVINMSQTESSKQLSWEYADLQFFRFYFQFNNFHKRDVVFTLLGYEPYFGFQLNGFGTLDDGRIQQFVTSSGPYRSVAGYAKTKLARLLAQELDKYDEIRVLTEE